jgi:hypothetical protein
VINAASLALCVGRQPAAMVTVPCLITVAAGVLAPGRSSAVFTGAAHDP